MSANIEELVKKHSRAFRGDVRGIRNALTEQAAEHALELRAYETTAAELQRKVDSVPVFGSPAYWVDPDDDANIRRVRRVGWSPLYAEAPNSIPADELATLREKAAMVDELRKDAERLRRLESEISDRLYSYERFGATCTFEGLPMVNADILEELAAIAQGKGE